LSVNLRRKPFLNVISCLYVDDECAHDRTMYIMCVSQN